MNQAILFLKSLQRESRFLTVVTYLLLVGFVGATVGLALDPRTITGAPAWMKPAKFAISSAIYAMTVAWLLRYIQWRPRLMRRAARVIGVVLLIEVALIFVQAARGHASHFNISTSLDGVIWSIMGTAIAILLIASAVLAVGLFRTTFSDVAWGWALRWGMAISVLGSSVGGMMTRPTSEQMERMAAGNNPQRVGQHTVGAPDGGPGLPVVNWSSGHGDLRIPHFFGLHAIQVVPFAVLFLRRRSVATTHVVAASYGVLIGILTSQALRGQALFAPDPITLSLLAAWAAISLTALIVVRYRTPVAATAGMAWGRP